MRRPKPVIVAKASSLVFERLELDLYEKHILLNPQADEKVAADFLANFPKFLFLGVANELRRESVLIGADGKPIGRVDFFRRTYGSHFWDIIELKKPHLPLITGLDGNHPHLSATISGAIEQAQDYKDWITADSGLRDRLLKKGIRVSKPQLLIVAGTRGKDIPDELFQTILERARVRGANLMTYTDIFDFAKEHYETHGVVVVPGNLPKFSLKEVSVFMGTHYARLKNETIELPPTWMLAPKDQLTMILWPKNVEGPCLRILPPKVMSELMTSMDAMTDELQKTQLKRMIGSSSCQVEVSNGGIAIPEEFMRAAGIENAAICHGLGDRFEIWDPNRFARLKADLDSTKSAT